MQPVDGTILRGAQSGAVTPWPDGRRGLSRKALDRCDRGRQIALAKRQFGLGKRAIRPTSCGTVSAGAPDGGFGPTDATVTLTGPGVDVTIEDAGSTGFSASVQVGQNNDSSTIW